MTMILGTLVVAVLVGLAAGKSEPQPYKEYEAELINAAKVLVENLISMEGHIPPLNNSRRQYAEIVHVVNVIAKRRIIYPYYPYNEIYYKYLNYSASEGINKPETVITEIQNLLDEVHNKTKELTLLISDCPLADFYCNALLHDFILRNQDTFSVPALIFVAAGRAAKEFNKHSGKFKEVSEDLNANQYVWTSPDDLRVLVAELSNLYEILKDLPHMMQQATL